MSMKEWAEREVEIACGRERGNASENEWNYGCGCYESALKAFNSLLDDGHSGMSIGFTKNILNRLINGKPLSPIEDTEDMWDLCQDDVGGGHVSYQNKRMSSLFKLVLDDGGIEYYDADYCYCVDINDPTITYSTKLVNDIIKGVFPISFPYYPTTDSIKVYCENFLTDKQCGGRDTVGIFNAIKPDGEKVVINKFFKLDSDDNGWVEIDIKEYKTRYLRKVQ
ncbi:hypothetical protein [[Clostridium] innocuum]|uniref:hypothetical protein n=1 Tax=Clostridium innocuum TaxID=1522 RepID=UPI001E2EEA82|nr:hypothetical protein [[Clostridium] innocuum]DAU14239.1 MAG TPA: hypothetical protein [Caudoviricetes sp.]MCC2832085.1 hypothetical protein [[Clostridium] innocuum]MCR0247011.1 hypothetical protein [[Clostridium] innocuum]MCR0258373.1 hypothetical protein [[Clostridium] innocuum]MCR0391071.1 hypothetical protein [[Clostridium] innocuum]